MNLSDIKRIYQSLISAKTLSEKRGVLHNSCKNIDFTLLIDKYAESQEVLMMIYTIKKEYESMISAANNPYKISEEELQARIEKLKLVDDIYQTCSNPYIRLDKMLKLFKNPNDFQKSYRLIIKFGNNDPKLEDIRPLLQDFDNYYNDFRKNYKNDVGKTVAEAYKEENEHSKLLYAEFIIKQYIIDPNSYLLEEWLKNYNISADDFKYFASLIQFNNKGLYTQYVIKSKKNAELFKNYNQHMFDDLAFAIQNGEFVYGNRFDALEFIKFLPFKNSHSFASDLESFLSTNNPFSKNIIINYIIKNGLGEKDGFKLLDKDSLYDAVVTLNDRTIETSELRKIIKYLNYRAIPISTISLKVACKMYLNNELDLSKLADMTLERKTMPIIIPVSN